MEHVGRQAPRTALTSRGRGLVYLSVAGRLGCFQCLDYGGVLTGLSGLVRDLRVYIAHTLIRRQVCKFLEVGLLS